MTTPQPTPLSADLATALGDFVDALTYNNTVEERRDKGIALLQLLIAADRAEDKHHGHHSEKKS